MKNKTSILLSIVALSTLLMSGCAKKTPAPTEKDFLCQEGKIQDKQDFTKCMVTTGAIKGTIENIVCNGDECKAYIRNERGNLIKIDKKENMNIGDSIDIILYEDATSLIKQK